MADEKLVEYIRSAVSRGASLEKVKQALLGKGWQQQAVDEAVGVAFPHEVRETKVPVMKPSLQSRPPTSFIAFALVAAIFIICLVSFYVLFSASDDATEDAAYLPGEPDREGDDVTVADEPILPRAEDCGNGTDCPDGAAGIS